MSAAEDRKPVSAAQAATYLRKHASVLIEMPANEQMIGARDSVLCSALHQIADAIDELRARESAIVDPPLPETAGDDETVVMFHIKPPLDETRWRALYKAAQGVGAVRVHINPPILRQRDQLLAALRNLHDAIPDATIAADQPLGVWVEIARDVIERVEAER